MPAPPQVAAESQSLTLVLPALVQAPVLGSYVSEVMPDAS